MAVTKSEARLLAALVTLAFVGGNYFGFEWLTKKQAALQHQYAELRADQAEAKVDLMDANQWQQRKEWIRAHEAALGDEGDAKAQTLETVLKGARDNKLDILEQSLNDAEHGAAGTKINVTVKVKGSMEALVKWLTDLQKPDQFYAISLFSLRADQDQKSMICSLQIARYFKDKGGS
jgi:hypothetical protein